MKLEQVAEILRQEIIKLDRLNKRFDNLESRITRTEDLVQDYLASLRGGKGQAQ